MVTAIAARRGPAYLAVAALALAAYHNAPRCGFVLDDYAYILENRRIASLWAIPGLFWRVYLSGGVQYFRPLSTASFAVDKALFGVWAAGYHLHNLAWHLAASLALLAFLRALVDETAALVAALLFAVHPVHTEAVTGIVGREELMTAAFVFAGLALHLRGRARPLVLACAFLALASKETGAALPFLALLFDPRRDRLVSRLRRALPFALPLGAYALLRLHALAPGALRPAAYFRLATPMQSFFSAIDTLGRYLLLLLWPHPLSADYSYAALPISPGLSSPRTALTVAALLLLAAAAYRLRARFLPLWWAVTGFAIAIFPVSNLVVHIGILMAERVLYLPSFALCLLAGALFPAARRALRRPLAECLIGALLLASTGLTLARNTDWDNPLTLWRDTVAKVPRSGLAHGNLALSCLTVGDRACALDELRLAVALDPTRDDFRLTLTRLEAQSPAW